MLLKRLKYPKSTVKRLPKIRCVICKRATTGGKAWCLNHAAQTPYALWITDRLKDFDAEIAVVRRHNTTRPIKEDGLLLQEIVKTLHFRGSRTIKGLSSDLSVDCDIIDIYVRYLIKKKMAAVRPTKKKDGFFIDLLIVPSFEAPTYHKEE